MKAALGAQLATNEPPKDLMIISTTALSESLKHVDWFNMAYSLTQWTELLFLQITQTLRLVWRILVRRSWGMPV